MRLLPLLFMVTAPLAAQARDTVVHRSACRVASVHDGDTFTCSGGRKVRLLRIDAPEIDQGTAGESAKEELLRLIHRNVTVTLELGRDSLDRYGRTLAFVWRDDGLMVNEEMIRRGWALVYEYNRKDAQYDARLEAAEDAAHAARRGWWRSGRIRCLPEEFRRRECP